jgi:hypothetical protein
MPSWTTRDRGRAPLAECREQQRTLERQAQEATFSQRSLEARRASCAHHRNRQQQARPWPRAQRAVDELGACPMPPPRAVCRMRWI